MNHGESYWSGIRAHAEGKLFFDIAHVENDWMRRSWQRGWLHAERLLCAKGIVPIHLRQR